MNKNICILALGYDVLYVPMNDTLLATTYSSEAFKIIRCNLIYLGQNNAVNNLL